MAEKNKKEKEQAGQTGQHERGTLAPHRSHHLGSSGSGFPLSRLRSEFDRLFDEYFQGWPNLWQQQRPSHWDLDVEDKEDKVVVHAEAPGFEPADFDLQVNENQLVLCACQSEEHKEDGGRHWQRQEFYRSVPLPSGIDAEHVEAQYRNGILTVTLPKTEQSKSKRIEVKS